MVDFARLHRSFGAFGHTLIAQVFWRDNGDDRHLAREFVLEDFIFTPGVQAVQDDEFLTSVNQVMRRFDDAFDDKIFAFATADFLAEFLLIVPSRFNASFFHCFVDDAAKVNFRNALFGEIFDRRTFAATSQTNEGDNVCMWLCHVVSIANLLY